MAGEVGILTVGQLINIVRLERLVRLIRHNAKLQNVIGHLNKTKQNEKQIIISIHALDIG